MKSLVNAVEDAVMQTLYGVSHAFPQLEYQVAHKVVLMPRLEERKDKVSLICGGGSGHEPFAAGFVGNGMLAASIAGSIYAAPPSIHISYAIDRISKHSQAGILMIVPNYTGDCLNFATAVEKAKQANVKIEDIMVNEDCSIPPEEQSVAGKRGLSGILFVMKIAGAFAEKGSSLEEVSRIAHEVLKNVATYAVGLTACAIPGQPPMFDLAEDEIEAGMGIHGEAGYSTMKLKSSNEITSFMLQQVCNALSVKSGDSVALIINNFGALSQLEQGVVVDDVVKHLRNMKVHPLRVYAGLLMTSLNSAGVHVTLLKIPEKNKTEFLSGLDAPTNAPKWPGCLYSVPPETARTIVQDVVTRSVVKTGVEINADLQKLLKQCLKSACESIIREEAKLNDLDRGCGDGDTGSTLARLTVDIIKNLDTFLISHPSTLFSELANISEDRMGGTSGALYCLFFTSIATELVSPDVKNGWTQIWAKALRSGLNRLIKYGKAKPGDRSMIDALNAVCESYESALSKPIPEICDIVKKATWKACESTKTMKPRVGRASYVKQARFFENVDAGAYAVATCTTAITDVLSNVKLSAVTQQPRRSIIDTKYKIKTDHDECCNCCCCTSQRLCYKYVQPEVPKSFKPIRHYWRSGLPMEKNTTYNLSYWECPGASVDPILPRNSLVSGEGAISDQTTYKNSYYEHCAKPAEPIIPCEKQWLGRGPMQDLTTQKHDFTWKNAPQVPAIKARDHIYCIPERLVDDTTYRLSYFGPCWPLPALNYAPIKTYLKPDIPMEDTTTYKLSYWPTDCTLRPEPICEKPEYVPPTEPVEGCTTYRLSFWPQVTKRRMPIVNPDTENVLNAGCCNDTNTTYNLSYFGCGGDTRTPIRQRNNLYCSPCPLAYDTIHRMSFLGNWGVQQNGPIIPCDKQFLGRGPMQDLTTQKHDFTWKNIPVEPELRRDDSFTFPAAPVEACTTYKLSYFEKDQAALTPTENYAPIRTFRPPDIPLEADTTMQLSYQPVQPSQVEKPWSEHPPYHPPVTRMEENSTYSTSYMAPGTLVP